MVFGFHQWCTNVYIPWGSKTSTDDSPGKIVPLLRRKPLRYGEFVCACFGLYPQEKIRSNKVTKVKYSRYA